MQIKRFIPLAGALGALALPTTASASATCRAGHSSDGTSVTLSRWGTTSCAMATATIRQATRRGFPLVLRVTSPATGRSYVMRRVSYEHRSSYFSAVYSGRGARGSSINVQIQLRGAGL